MSHQGRHGADEALLLALACGATKENAARKAGVSERTVYRRLKDRDFRQRLQALRTDMVQRAANVLTASSMEAVKTLLSLQDASVPNSVRLGAARAILEQGTRLRELADLEERLAALEQRMEEKSPA
jgi:AcrR family transcriptional regulator